MAGSLKVFIKLKYLSINICISKTTWQFQIVAIQDFFQVIPAQGES